MKHIALLLGTLCLVSGCSQELPRTEPNLSGVELLNSTPFPVLVREAGKDPVLVLSGKTTVVDSDMTFGFIDGDCRFEIRKNVVTGQHALVCIEILREVSDD